MVPRTVGWLRRRVITLAATGACAAGFSTVETAAVVGSLSVVSATAAPHLREYVDSARRIKAAGETRVIALSLVRLVNDVGPIGAHQQPRPRLLVTDGDVPSTNDPPSEPWSAPIDEQETQPLAAHLLDNAANYRTALDGGGRWRGPYMDMITADPWGMRYGVNVGFVAPGGGRMVIVVSPGPNQVIETPFDMVESQPRGDDIMQRLGLGR